MSIRKDIRDAVIIALDAEPRPGDGVPFATKRRWSPGKEDRDPEMNVFYVEEPVDAIGGRSAVIVKRRLTLAIQCVVSTPVPTLSDDLVEPLLEHVTERIGVTNFNGLVTDVQEQRTTWETAKLDRYYLAATVFFVIEYQTKRNDLSSKQ